MDGVGDYIENKKYSLLAYGSEACYHSCFSNQITSLDYILLTQHCILT